LGGVVFCRDPRRARALAVHLDSGVVWINHGAGSQAGMPVGGIKRSGCGREASHLGIQEFINRKLVRTYPAGARSDTQ
jgi:succinate-semialdehyde dehydrogenase/glutarate-semialdehyde dehydrogenase